MADVRWDAPVVHGSGAGKAVERQRKGSAMAAERAAQWQRRGQRQWQRSGQRHGSGDLIVFWRAGLRVLIDLLDLPALVGETEKGSARQHTQRSSRTTGAPARRGRPTGPSPTLKASELPKLAALCTHTGESSGRKHGEAAARSRKRQRAVKEKGSEWSRKGNERTRKGSEKT